MSGVDGTEEPGFVQTVQTYEMTETCMNEVWARLAAFRVSVFESKHPTMMILPYTMGGDDNSKLASRDTCI